MTLGGENQGKIQIKTIAIIIAVIAVALIINNWMGKEMNRSVVNPAVVQPVEKMTENVVAKTTIIPPEPIQEQVEETRTSTTQKNVAPKEEKIEPVYDTPSNDIILIQ